MDAWMIGQEDLVANGNALSSSEPPNEDDRLVVRSADFSSQIEKMDLAGIVEPRKDVEFRNEHHQQRLNDGDDDDDDDDEAAMMIIIISSPQRVCAQVMKTYHMYHAESISAESKLKEAEKQEEKQFNKSGDLSMNLLRHEDRPQRRSSRQAKYSENKLKCTKARNDYLLNLAATNAAISKYYIHDVSDLIDCCDLGFHASLARTFRTYLSAEYNLETSRHEGLDVIENAVDNLDSRSDKHTVMDMCNQVFCPPLKFEFQPHMGDEVCQVSAQQPVQTELLMRYHQLQSRLATLKIENEEVRKTLDATMQTLQDMLTVEDFDVSDAFQHSRSTESVKSAASETYMSKINIAKRRANQQETEMFYFTKFKEYVNGSNLITKLQAKHDLLKQTLGEGESGGGGLRGGAASPLGVVVAP
ncbi:hypothetical protein HPG69_008293 [Diceros bicornis minor]|uniref:F-BAR domain-containing protein n=1 Tax=Diceros bicornis minor TaxID=77932 RepID=A0A7J7F3C6_DICBM|nr:hypothetical protein HPG69_008293 [Diceros bicornis minor]